MRTLLCGALALGLSMAPALAQDNVKSANTLDPTALSQAKRPPLTVSAAQTSAIRDGLVAEHTQQKAPKDFQPQVGQTLPMTMTVDVMPQDLTRRDPSLKQYGYAKTAADILVLDPMSKTIIAVVPRKFPADAKAKPATGTDWAKTKGRELTGQAPEPAAGNAPAQEPAGDSGDVKNGNGNNAKEK